MIKPIAILKDSLREAWDSKTLLVMLILVGLCLLGVASIGYTEATPRRVFEDYAEDLSKPVIRTQRGKVAIPMQLTANGPPKELATYSVTTYRVVKEANHAPNGEYEFTILVKSEMVSTDGPQPKAKDNNGKEKEKEKADAKKEPAKDGAPLMDGFELAVAMWHEDGSEKFIKVEGKNQLDPSKMKIRVSAVTDEMVREFFAEELDRRTQVPIVGFERIAGENETDRVYKITTGPSTEPRVWPVNFSLGFGAYTSPSPSPLGVQLFIIQNVLLSSVGGFLIILVAVIITAFFIPNMLHPGSVVLLLSKPINRPLLLLFKYLGGLFFVLILTTVAVGGVWLITGIRAGVWAPGIFAIIPLLTLSFAILYAVSTLAAVWTRNSIVSILVTLAFGFTLWLVGKVEAFASIERMKADALAAIKNEEPKYDQWVNVVGGLNKTLPRWQDIDTLTGQAVANSLMTIKQQELQGSAMQKHMPTWSGTISVTMVWIIVLLGVACWRFTVKDY